MVAKFENNKRVAKNTLFLYARMLLLMLVSLYTSRIVLAQLGVVDFGLNNVIAGVIGMFLFLQGAMSVSVQRYLSYEMGRENEARLHIIFNLSVYIYFALGLLIFVLGETIGLWFVKSKLVIPPDRLHAAIVVYHCAVVSTVFSILKIPYNAVILSSEKFNIYAYISIFEVLLTLAVAFSLCYISYDKWQFYNVVGLVLTFCFTLFYVLYVYRKYPFSRFCWVWNKEILHGMLGFSVWTMLTELSWMLVNQGTTMLLNNFCGAIVNAARAISFSVYKAVLSFVVNFEQALNPQLIKLYASQQKSEMFELLFRGSKFSLFLISLLALPIIFECQFILELWLGKVPPHTVLFCQLIMIATIVDICSNLLVTLSKAYGDIKKFQIVTSLLLFLNFPLSYIFLKLDFFPEVIVCIYIFISIMMLWARLSLLKKMVKLSPSAYLSKVLFPVSKVLSLSAIVLFCLCHVMNEGVIRFVVVGLMSVLTIGMSALYIGMNSKERAYVLGFIKNKMPFLSTKQ